MNYNIDENIAKSKKEVKNPSYYFESEILKQCPFEKRILYPGKLYVFKYFLHSKTKLYDMYPYIMSLGPKPSNNERFYGINMHIMPYKIRLQIFKYLYELFYSIIDTEIEKYPEAADSIYQKYILQANTDLITKSPFKVNIKPCIHSYDMKHISECRNINYNLIHYMLQSETNYFENGSIADAQDGFVKDMYCIRPTKMNNQ